MTPTLRINVAAHAKRQGMSFSEFVTILCVNYMDAVSESGEGPDRPKAEAGGAREERKRNAGSAASVPPDESE